MLFKRIFSVMFVIGVICLGCLLVAAVYWDRQVVEKFSGKKWQVPAKVYARPMELYVGAPLTLKNVRDELDRLRYQSDASLHQPGRYQVRGQQLLISTRGFQFWDGFEEKQQIKLSFADNQIDQLSTLEDTETDIVRLEPVLIGGIFPDNLEDRILVKIDEVPPLLIQTLLLTEDRRFFSHAGLSPISVGRAAIANIRAGGLVEGGSTLTQQLVKNFFLNSDRTFNRKVREAVMAMLLELHYSKNEILEAYLNEIYLGQANSRSINGFGLASHHYFGQPLTELDPSQMALLVAMVKGPSYYHPLRNAERAKQRRDHVLSLLAEAQVLTAIEVSAEQAKPIQVLRTPPQAVNPYPDFLDLVNRQLRHDYPEDALKSEGLQIFTTLDVGVQSRLEKAMRQRLSALNQAQSKAETPLQAAAVVTEPKSGEVLALLGSAEPGSIGFNRAVDAKRQIGSTIKPLVYLLALQASQYQLNTFISDEPFSIRGQNGKNWAPDNYDHRSHGQVMLQEALVHSYNLATARLGMDLGIEQLVTLMRRLGIDTPMLAVPSLTLGAVDLTPLQVATLYQPLAGDGFNSPIRAIRAVQQGDGTPLTRYALQVSQVISPEHIYLLKHALQQVTNTGTAAKIRRVFGNNAGLAGKTGTTDDARDSWFTGFSENYLAVVWIGRDNNQPAKLTGAQGALNVWIDLMQQLNFQPIRNPTPAGYQQVWLDQYTGLLSDEGCPGAVWVAVSENALPNESSGCRSQRQIMDSNEDYPSEVPQRIWRSWRNLWR
jgi:penicillin-binding protein 1B